MNSGFDMFSVESLLSKHSDDLEVIISNLESRRTDNPDAGVKKPLLDKSSDSIRKTFFEVDHVDTGAAKLNDNPKTYGSFYQRFP